MQQFLQHFAKGRKPVTEDHRSYDPISKKCSNLQTERRSLIRPGKNGVGKRRCQLEGTEILFAVTKMA